MNENEVIEYLKTWAKLNTREVYGSPREYIRVYDLIDQLSVIQSNLDR